MIAPSAPALTEKTTPGHGVEVYFSTIDGDAVSINVWKIADGQTVLVRGAQKATVSGDFTVTDWEVPNGVAAVYFGEIFDSSGASIISPQSSITISWDEVVIMNPVDPSEQFTIELQSPSFQGAVQGSNNKQVYVMGVRRPFNQYWGPGALQEVPLEIWSRTDSETRNMQSLTEAGQWLLRTPPSYNFLPRLLYMAVRPLPFHPREKWNDSNDIVQWLLTVDEVQPVSAAVLRPLVTWADWESAFPSPATWDDVAAVYGGGTWTDAVRNPPSV